MLIGLAVSELYEEGFDWLKDHFADETNALTDEQKLELTNNAETIME